MDTGDYSNVPFEHLSFTWTQTLGLSSSQPQTLLARLGWALNLQVSSFTASQGPQSQPWECQLWNVNLQFSLGQAGGKTCSSKMRIDKQNSFSFTSQSKTNKVFQNLNVMVDSQSFSGVWLLPNVSHHQERVEDPKTNYFQYNCAAIWWSEQLRIAASFDFYTKVNEKTQKYTTESAFDWKHDHQAAKILLSQILL